MRRMKKRPRKKRNGWYETRRLNWLADEIEIFSIPASQSIQIDLPKMNMKQDLLRRVTTPLHNRGVAVGLLDFDIAFVG